MIYGSPVFHVVDDQTNRIGIRTLVLSQLWQPSRWPMTLLELDAEKPAPPATAGGLLLIGTQTRPDRGGLRTFWTFEGINGDGKEVTFKDRAHSIDYGFEPGFSEKSLLRVPGIQTLMDKYGGYPIDNQIVWPPTITDGSSTSSGAQKPDSNTGDPNPLYGQDTFFAIEGTYHFRYVVRDTSEIPNIGGMIFTDSAQLPGQPPRYKLIDGKPPKGRSWMALAPAPVRVGPVHQVTESYWLSGDGGWPKVIYDFLKGIQNGSGGSGLQTGSLQTGGL